MKICSICKTNKPLSEFYGNKTRRTSVASACKLCQKERMRICAAKRGLTRLELGRISKLKTVYGITPKDRALMFTEQDGLCGICRKQPIFKKDGLDNFYIDHNHQTGKIRGLLCNSCNRVLGIFKDDISLFKSAISYLQRTDIQM